MSFRPDKPTSPASSPEPQHPKASKGLACIFCQQRKVKCDRQRPCASCTKARVTCTYRARQAPRRRHTKATEVSLRARLGRLEELLKTAVSRNAAAESLDADDVSPGANVSNQASDDFDSVPMQLQNTLNIAEDPKITASSPLIPGQLVSGHGRSRYIENKLWNKIYEQLKDTQEMLDESSSDEEEAAAPATDLTMDPTQGDLTFGTATSRRNLRALHPNPSHILTLWTTFLENVNPLIKIVHVPTTQNLIQEASQDLDSTTKSVNALLFAIYLAAASSLTDQECPALFGEPRSTLLSRYKYAAQKALLSANYLKSPDLMVLQAFVIYLLAARPYYDARTFWAICGLSVRIAQRIGVHKDGAVYGIPPFEVEMRRRLWWQIVFLDVRAAEVCGAGLTVVTLGDTKRPLNINDEDIYPNMPEPPTERQGTTEMCFVMLRSSIGYYFKYLYRPQLTSEADMGKLPNAELLQDKTLQELMDDFESYLNENFLRNADPLNHVQFFTSMVARAILCSWRVMDAIRKASDKTDTNTQQNRDTLFEECLKGIEYDNLAHATTSMRRFDWHIGAHFQWHSLIALLGELRSRTAGELVEKAWQQIGHIFDHHPEIIKTRNPLHTAIGNLTLAAWKVREAEFSRRYPIPIAHATPDYILALQRQRLARERSIDQSNSESPPTLSTFSPSNLSGTQTFTSNPASLSTDSTFGLQGGAGDVSAMSSSTSFFDSNQMDWNAWDSLLQNYEFPAPTEGTEFLMPKDDALGGFYE